MSRGWWCRFGFLVAAALLSGVMVAPTLLGLGEDSRFPVKSRINLGLDLQGGLYMVLGIDFERVYRDEVRTYAQQVVTLLADEEIPARLGGPSGADPLDPRHSVVLEDPSDAEAAKDEVRRYFGSLVRLTGDAGGELAYGLASATKTGIEQESVAKSIEVIRNRTDEFGVTEPEIVSQGKDRIVVQLPGVRDIERAKNLIGQTAKLEFRLVNDEASDVQALLDKARDAGVVRERDGRLSDHIDRLNDFLREDLPEGYQLAFQRVEGGGDDDLVPFVVESVPHVTGDMLQDARVQIDPLNNRPYVSLEFNAQGSESFAEVTTANVGNFFAIILDGNVYSAPRINEPITGGRAQIDLGAGNYNRMMEEARDLARVLRAGALPVQLDFLEQRTVGPSLGRDSIDKALFAGQVGAVLVFVFIVFYYGLSGAIAMACLVLNVLFVLACLVSFEATLTLPGIAGIALTIGMAVDACIIIYERIREEVRRGVGCYRASENGFNQAFWTIIDANTTTALAGVCLLNFGTGPIRGFAVTLLIGIVATVYTSYFVGRLLFEFYMDRVKGQWLSI